LTTFLLDVNVLIALVDPTHVQHDEAHAWFSRLGKRNFATCPITENGLMRIVGHPRYPNSPGPPSAIAKLLRAFRAMPGHHFWPDNISVVDDAHIDVGRLSSHGRVTDSYLLALAGARGGRLATLDHKLSPEAVRNGAMALELI
jgi:uncharacterized protein